MSEETQNSLPRLLAAKIAAVLLACYALFYAVLLIAVVGSNLGADDDTLYFLALLVMATTPFFAFFQLLRATRGNPDKPVRPLLMALVMAAPAVYWLYITFGEFQFLFRGWADFLASMGLAGIPGLLSAWLVGTFLWLAVRKYQAP